MTGWYSALTPDGPHCKQMCGSSAMSYSQDTSSTDLFSDDDDIFDELPSHPIISVPLVLPAENSLPQLLAQACGTEDYHHMTSVRLKVVASQTSLQRLYMYLPNLVELDLTGSFLQSLRTLGYGLESLKVLRVGRCSLSDLDGLFGVPDLRELYAAYNTISNLALIATLPYINTLDLSSNQVSSLIQVSFLKMCDRLQNLILTDCPITEIPSYRASVVTTLPRLASLDGLLLAQSGLDICGDGSPITSDHSEGEDGASALPIESISTLESLSKEAVEESDLGRRRRRAVTAHGPRPRREDLPPRPSTAVTKNSPMASLSASGMTMVDPEAMGDSVSELTSGGVVCGNLAAALRGKHSKRKLACSTTAWHSQETDEKVVHENGLNVSQLYSDVNVIEEGMKFKGGGDGGRNPLLEASRQWRHTYHLYRNAKREEWNNEDEEGP